MRALFREEKGVPLPLNRQLPWKKLNPRSREIALSSLPRTEEKSKSQPEEMQQKNVEARKIVRREGIPNPSPVLSPNPFSSIPSPPEPEEPNGPRIIKRDREPFKSRVGYFVSISDFYFTESTSSISTSGRVSFEFEEEGILFIEPGETWKSDWLEGEIIRGMDINAIGDTKWNYINNAGFEL